MEQLSAAMIARLYDPYVGHSEDASPYVPNADDLPAGALAAALEFFTLHGTIISPLYAVPAAELYAHPEVQALGEVHTLKLKEQKDAPWILKVTSTDVDRFATFLIDDAELQPIFARDNIILHGKPSKEEFESALSL